MMENSAKTRSGKRIGGRCFAALLAAATLLASPAMAQRLGLVADDGTDSVIVFDIDSNAVLGAVPVGPGTVGDVAITPDQTLGFVTDFNRRVWVIDLTTSPPSLAEGNNPIAISNPGEELTVTPDGRFLLVNNGAGPVQPISVIDIAARIESSTLSIGSDIVSNDLCDDGSSVLVASVSGRSVRRLILAEDGTLSDSGELLRLSGASQSVNVYCAPGSNAGLVLSFTDKVFRSFTVPDLTPVDSGTLLGNGNSAVFSAAGDRVFVRSGTPGSVEVFDFDPVTGDIGLLPSDAVPVAQAIDFFGIDQLALGAGDGLLYVPEGLPVSAVSLFDAADLAAGPVDSITGPDFLRPTGIVLGNLVAFEALDLVLELDDGEELELEGAFTLSAASNGIDPLAEEVTLAVGSLSVTIPAGSFKAVGDAFVFEGVIDGGELELEIALRADGSYSFEAEAEDLDLSSLQEPVSVVLTIGDDRSETLAAVVLDD